MKQWYALRSKPKSELTAVTVLSRAGLQTYLPQTRVCRRPGKPPSLEPFFPGYLFGRLDPQLGEIRLARYSPGILYVVGSGDEPCPIPDDLVLAIQNRLARQRQLPWPADFRPGDRVVITSGPLKDVEAIFDRCLSAMGRVRVLVRIIDRLCAAEAHVGQLRLASQAAGTR